MRARKALGQHFLSDPRLLARIAAATTSAPGDVILEIGPGPGALTAALLDRGATVVAIERDARMAGTLTRQFAGRDFVLVEGDALEVDWAALVRPWTDAGATWRVAGNIPYYITSPLLDAALSAPLPASVTYLVQREVADRVVAPPGHDAYGALSIGIQAVATAMRGAVIPAGAFSPPPKVDSAVLHLVPLAAPAVPPARIAAFRRLVTGFFSYRRKRMHRAARSALGLSAEAASALLSAAALDPDVRPEVVDVAGWARLLACHEAMPSHPAASSSPDAHERSGTDHERGGDDAGTR